MVDWLIYVGAVSCNLEDSDHRASGLQDARSIASRSDCLYPIGVGHLDDIATLFRELPGSINGTVGRPLDLADFRELGVARGPYGPRFYRAARADFSAADKDVFA